MQDSRDKLVDLKAPIAGTVVYIAQSVGTSVYPETVVLAIESTSLVAVPVNAGVVGQVQKLAIEVDDVVQPDDVLAVLLETPDAIVAPEAAAASPAQVCTHCGYNALEPGFVLESFGERSQGFTRWVEGALERGRFGTARMKGRRTREIEAFRCLRCSHVELFATNLE